MSKVQQTTFPIQLLGVGPHGPFTTGLLPPDLAGYVLDLVNDGTWPPSGPICTITVEQSNDSGASWLFDAALKLEGLWKNRQGVTVNTTSWNVSIDNRGSLTRKVRISVDVAQACRLGATASSY